MPFPRGADPEKAVLAYIGALQGFPIDAISAGIRKFLRGECEDVSKKFCPHPPELASIVRDCQPNKSELPTGKLYGCIAPRSEILERKCTKEWARQLIRQGVHPRGSIWYPGDITDHPEIGTLYAPDDSWREAWPLNREGGH